jgi:NADH-quinone oxidoreductase subunit J
MSMVAFGILSALAVISAVVVISHRNPVISALSLAANLISIAGFYLLLNAQFLALLQVIVYAGAIMVLILFVIMMLNLPAEGRRQAGGRIQRGLTLILATMFVVVVGYGIGRAGLDGSFDPPAEGFGTVGALGMTLFTNYFYAFEAISLLLVVAMVGAVLLAKRRL